MRTTNFSAAPPLGQAGVQFLSESVYHSPWALWRFLRRWPALERQLRVAPGFCGIRNWYRFPLTLGMVVFFTDRAALLAFAHDTAHRTAMAWLVEAGVEQANYIRLYDVAPSGYSSGAWQAPSPTPRPTPGTPGTVSD